MLQLHLSNQQFVAYVGASYIRDFMVLFLSVSYMLYTH